MLVVLLNWFEGKEIRIGYGSKGRLHLACRRRKDRNNFDPTLSAAE
jgi:hypothetical protein